jgi:hypothetical protein
VRLAIASVFTLLLATGPVLAQGSPDVPTQTQSEPKPTEDSIRQLLEVIQARKIIEAESKQIDGVYAAMINKFTEGKSLTDEQKKAIDAGRARITALVQGILTWDSMQQTFMKVYSETFSQSEIDGMIGFYSSPIGQAVVAKLPTAMQNAMGAMQERIQTLMPQIQQVAKQTADEIKASSASTGKNKAG